MDRDGSATSHAVAVMTRAASSSAARDRDGWPTAATAGTRRAARPTPLSEREFQHQVVDLAKVLGWGTLELPDGSLDGLIYHPQLSKWSERGWPDLAMARRRDGRFLLAELKAERGVVSARQVAVIDLLRACGVEVHVFRPSDLADPIETSRVYGVLR